MKLEYAGIAKENLKSGINIDKISTTQRTKHINNIYNKKVSDMLDWIDLPDTDMSTLMEIKNFGHKIHKKFQNFVVLGIGGSALGVSMLKNTFIDSLNKDCGINVYVCDNIDSDSFVSLLDKLNLKRTMFNVITKSGSTSETLAQMLLVISRYQRKNIDFSKHMVITTTKGNELSEFATRNDIKTFDIPEGVGGRFSVLSAVGLLPASVMGIDIFALMEGAKMSRTNSQLNDIKNIAYTTAHINFTYLKSGLTNLVVMPYSDRLALVPEFFAQLWAESLGKKIDRNGEEIFAGQTPIKTKGVTDQHSQLQLYSEGIKDKLVMFITVEKNCFDEMIESNVGIGAHLLGTSLKTLLDFEYLSTAYSLTTLDRPNYTLSLKTITEQSMGEFIFFMEMMTAFMGEMLSINTYDQPGVELSKIYTKACLGLKGYEDKGKEIKLYKKEINKFRL